MPYACELDNEDISIYFGLISTEHLMTSAEKEHIIQAYTHLMKCDNCRNYYDDFKKRIQENGALFDGKRVHVNFEQILKNEKILEALFRN